MPNPIESELEMNFGLTDITQSKHEKPKAHLPHYHGFDPGEGKIENRLSKVVSVRNFEDVLLHLLQPVVEDRKILHPLEFRQKLREMVCFFQQKREYHDDPAMEPVWDALIALLENEEEKGGLLEHYRHTLHMG